MFRHDIYCNHFGGSPNRQLNFEAIQRLEYHGRNLPGSDDFDAPTVILPSRIWQPREQSWEALDWYQFHGLPAPPTLETRRDYLEWMPGVGTVALFRSDGIVNAPEGGNLSHLLVMWFQNEPTDLIEPEALEAIRHLRWNALATSMLLPSAWTEAGAQS